MCIIAWMVVRIRAQITQRKYPQRKKKWTQLHRVPFRHVDICSYVFTAIFINTVISSIQAQKLELLRLLLLSVDILFCTLEIIEVRGYKSVLCIRHSAKELLECRILHPIQGTAID
jgi:hypothetical protein